MKNKVLLIVFFIVLISFSIFAIIFSYKQVMAGDNLKKTNNNEQINLYNSEETVNLISNVEPFLFTKNDIKLFYHLGKYIIF